MGAGVLRVKSSGANMGQYSSRRLSGGAGAGAGGSTKRSAFKPTLL